MDFTLFRSSLVSVDCVGISRSRSARTARLRDWQFVKEENESLVRCRNKTKAAFVAAGRSETAIAKCGPMTGVFLAGVARVMTTR